MKQSERNRTCPITQSYLNKGQQPPVRRVRRHTNPDVLNQAFINPNSNDYRRKRISNQFDATPVAKRGRLDPSNNILNRAFVESPVAKRGRLDPSNNILNRAFVESPVAKRGRLDPSDNILNRAFVESRPTRGNHSKTSSDVLNTAMNRGSNFQSRRMSNQYTGSQVRRGNSYPSRNITDRSYIEPRRYKENIRSSEILNSQAYKYPRSNEYKTTRTDIGKKPLSQRENLRSTGNFSTSTGRGPVKRRPIVPTNTRNVPNKTYSNLNKVQNSGQCNRKPSTVRGDAPLLTEECTNSRKPTPRQALSFRVRCTPQVSALSTSNKVTSAGQQSSCSRIFHEALLCHLARPSSTSQTFSPKLASPDTKKTPGTMNCKSAPQFNQKATFPEADYSTQSIQSSQDIEDDCFGGLKELFPELNVELPKNFWADPSKRLLLRGFLEDLKQEDSSDNLSENVSNSTLIKPRPFKKKGCTQAESTTRPKTRNKVPNVDNNEEHAKRKALFIKHVRNDLKEKIPQLQLVVKMLELVMSWKRRKQLSNKKRCNSDESATSKRGSAVGGKDETPGWCYCYKIKPDQLPNEKALKQEVTTPETVKIENIALKPEPL